ncbi:MAG TPA: hypothetical protein VGL13_10945, partial [Polyangiaceae bacterium]
PTASTESEPTSAATNAEPEAAVSEPTASAPQRQTEPHDDWDIPEQQLHFTYAAEKRTSDASRVENGAATESADAPSRDAATPTAEAPIARPPTGLFIDPSFDRPTPPTPFPTVAALAAATHPSSWDEPPITTRAPATSEKDIATAPGIEPAEDADAVDIEFSDEAVEDSGTVTDWIELKSADPDMSRGARNDEPTVIIAPDPQDLAPESHDSDDAVPTMRKVTAANGADPGDAKTDEEDDSADRPRDS